jgi:hypothetical protein
MERTIMPSHDADRLSRRSLLAGAATAGAAGLAVTAIGAPALAAPRPTPPRPGTDRPSTDRPTADGGAPLPAGPIMVHVRDAGSGDIELFSGTSQTRLRDKDLAARIARAIR